MKFDEWAAKVIQLFALAGYSVHAFWANKLPAMFDRGYSPSDAVRVVILGVRVGQVFVNVGQRGQGYAR